jgi:uncharacterized protein (TIGR02270 family)
MPNLVSHSVSGSGPSAGPSAGPDARRRFAPAVVPTVLAQHAEEAAMLRHARGVLVRAPHAGLLQLGRFDERIAAHLDGLLVGGRAAQALCKSALERPEAGEIFTFASLALASRDLKALDHAIALAAALPAAWRGVASALGWISAAGLQGVVRELLVSKQPAHRALGITACRLHRVDPGAALQTALLDTDTTLRMAAARAAGELGRVDLLEAVVRAMADDQADVVFWAARSACLLGDRKASRQVLAVAATAQQTPQDWADAALAMTVLSAPADEAGAWVRQLFTEGATAGQAAAIRRQLRAVGLLGDVRLVPWLIDKMGDPALARLAGEAFSWITGADLARLDLETLDPPADPAANDDNDDDSVLLDADQDLPWPDPAKVRAWWAQQSALPGYQAALAGRQRLFAGEPPSLVQAKAVLGEGTQRLRATAAAWARVLSPGKPLFSVAAPAHRQRRWLADPGTAP